MEDELGRMRLDRDALKQDLAAAQRQIDEAKVWQDGRGRGERVEEEGEEGEWRRRERGEQGGEKRER